MNFEIRMSRPDYNTLGLLARPDAEGTDSISVVVFLLAHRCGNITGPIIKLIRDPDLEKTDADCGTAFYDPQLVDPENGYFLDFLTFILCGFLHITHGFNNIFHCVDYQHAKYLLASPSSSVGRAQDF